MAKIENDGGVYTKKGFILRTPPYFFVENYKYSIFSENTDKICI